VVALRIKILKKRILHYVKLNFKENKMKKAINLLLLLFIAFLFCSCESDSTNKNNLNLEYSDYLYYSTKDRIGLILLSYEEGVVINKIVIDSKFVTGGYDELSELENELRKIAKPYLIITTPIGTTIDINEYIADEKYAVIISYNLAKLNRVNSDLTTEIVEFKF